jgi:hypothetical protein
MKPTLMFVRRLLGRNLEQHKTRYADSRDPVNYSDVTARTKALDRILTCPTYILDASKIYNVRPFVLLALCSSWVFQDSTASIQV